jgi:catalase (peroxidase I)
MDHPDRFRDAFKSLGFDAWEQAALMGAHTFGKITAIGCSGQFKGIQYGPFCNQQEQLDPPVAPEQLVENGCKPELGKITKFWSKGKSSKGKTTLNPAFYFKNNKDIRPKAAWFGGGVFWDRTPTTFDNDYFRLFHQEDFNDKNNCCGSFGRVREYNGCTQGGPMQDRTRKLIGGPCDHSWCRKDHGHKEVMTSTKAWAEPDHEFINRASAWGPTRKMVRLPGDWALLGHNETRQAVEAFAKDQALFFSTFNTAFGKVLDRGHSLSVCTP